MRDICCGTGPVPEHIANIARELHDISKKLDTLEGTVDRNHHELVTQNRTILNLLGQSENKGPAIERSGPREVTAGKRLV